MSFIPQQNPIFRTVALFHLLGGIYGLATMTYQPGSRFFSGQNTQLIYMIFSTAWFISVTLAGILLMRNQSKAVKFNKIVLATQFIQFSIPNLFVYSFYCLAWMQMGIGQYLGNSDLPVEVNTSLQYIFEYGADSFVLIVPSQNLWFLSVSPLPILLFILLTKESKKLKRKMLKHKIGQRPSQKEIEQRTEELYNNH